MVSFNIALEIRLSDILELMNQDPLHHVPNISAKNMHRESTDVEDELEIINSFAPAAMHKTPHSKGELEMYCKCALLNFILM